MATYVLTFLGVVAVASTVVGLVGAFVVATAEWIQRQASSRRTDLAGGSSYEPQPFTEAHSEYDAYRSALARAHHSRPPIDRAQVLSRRPRPRS